MAVMHACKYTFGQSKEAHSCMATFNEEWLIVDIRLLLFLGGVMGSLSGPKLRIHNFTFTLAYLE